MPDLKRSERLGPSRAHDSEFNIVVQESDHLLWPTALTENQFGEPLKRIRSYFLPFLAAIRRARREYLWKAFFLDSSTGRNVVEQYPKIVDQLELLFERELGSKYSFEQRELLLQSHIVIVAVSKSDMEIAGYFSSSYEPRNAIKGIPIPITFGNHGVIAADHQQYKIGVTMGAITTLHGQRFRDLFSTFACVLRTNNRNILNPLKQAGIVYRSDELSGPRLCEEEEIAKSAMAHMHSNLFQLGRIELPWDQPLKIEHRFDSTFVIDGVREDEIIYICCVTSLAKCIFRLFARRPRRKKRHDQ